MILLSDGYLANGSEPWRLPNVDDLPDISVPFQTELNAVDRAGNDVFWPYLRDADTLARPWAIPGTPGLMHRIGGLEKADGTGNVNYTPGEPRQDGGVAGRQDRADRRRPSGARDPGRSRCRTVLAGLGIDLGRDRRRHAAPPPCRTQDRVDPSHAPQPAPERPRREAEPVPPCAGARAQQRSADAARAQPSTWSTPRPSPRSWASRSSPARSKPRSKGSWSAMTDAAVNLTSKKDWASDQEVRWCPGCGDYGILLAVQQLMPELGVLAREHGVHLGHRVFEPLPLLHEHVRHALDPRPGAGDRDGRRGRPSRPRRVGDHRRRRRAVDRRQPPDPRPATQRQPHDPALQQPHLRAHEGPVLTDVGGRQGHQVDPVRLRRSAVQPALGGAGGGGQLRRPHPRPRPQAHDRRVPRRPRPPRFIVRRDLPELQRVQRPPVRRRHQAVGARRDDDRPRPRSSRSASAPTVTGVW